MARKYTRKVRRNKRHTRRQGGGILETIKGALPFGKKGPASTHTVHRRNMKQVPLSSYRLPNPYNNAIGVRN